MALNPYLTFLQSLPQLTGRNNSSTIRYSVPISNLSYLSRRSILHAISKNSDENSDDNPKSGRTKGQKDTEISENEDEKTFPTTIPKKSRRGRRSEAHAVEDFMRNSLEKTFAAIRGQDSEVIRDKEDIMKEKIDEVEEEDDVEDEGGEKNKKMVMEVEDADWPVDAEVGWGIRASEYFEKYPIKNVVGEDGAEIDWEGELDDNLVKEINCLEWESFAFHPSPIIVLVFERYNRASLNWKVLKDLEKAAKVFWTAKDRLPPRTVKIDMNIERDLAYALKIRECPQILFLRGNRILHREQQIRTADELVEMIGHFYYNAKKPSFMKAKKP